MGTSDGTHPRIRMSFSKDSSDSYVTVGRNDPCPCGSGKRFKDCHGRPLYTPTPSTAGAQNAEAVAQPIARATPQTSGPSPLSIQKPVNSKNKNWADLNNYLSSNPINENVNSGDSPKKVYKKAKAAFKRGKKYYNAGNMEKTEYYLQESLRLYSSVHNSSEFINYPINVSNCSISLGNLYYETNRPAQAEIYLRKGINTLTNYLIELRDNYGSNIPNMSIAQNYLAQSYQLLAYSIMKNGGDRKEVEQFLRKSLALYRELDMKKPKQYESRIESIASDLIRLTNFNG